MRYAEAASGDPLPEFLSVAEAKHLIAFLSNARPRPGASGARRDAHAAFTWQELRNRVAVALHLGGGLTPAEVRALTLNSPISRGGRVRDRPWKISIPAIGDAPARETPIAPWAGELLQHWLLVRSERKIPGEMLFPSTADGQALEQAVPLRGDQAAARGGRSRWQRGRNLQAPAHLCDAATATRNGA